MLQHSRNYTSLALNVFVQRLNDIGAIKIDTAEGFKLKLHDTNPEAPLSPLYFNLRLADNKQGPLTYSEIQQMADFMFLYICHNKLGFDGICGIPRAGDPFAEELQKRYFYSLNIQMPRVHLEKYEGTSIRHIGNVQDTSVLKPGSRVLLLDDLITKADSKFEAAARLRDAGYIVTDCMVFLDRQQGGAWQLNERGIRLHSIIGLTNVLEILKDTGRITPQQHKCICDYIESNK